MSPFINGMDWMQAWIWRLFELGNKSKYLGYPKQWYVRTCDRKERRAAGPETISHTRPPFLSGEEGAIRKIGTLTLAIVGISLLTPCWAATVGSSCIQWAADTCSPSFPRGSQEPGIQGQLQQPWALSLHSLWLMLCGVTRTHPALSGQGMEAIRPTQEIWEAHILAVTAILFPSAPLATTDLGKIICAKDLQKDESMTVFYGNPQPYWDIYVIDFSHW